MVSLKLKSKNLGWIAKVQKKRYTYSTSLSKLVAVGSVLKSGDKLYSYLCEDDKGRNVVVTYLDGEQREKGKNIKLIDYNTFIDK